MLHGQNRGPRLQLGILPSIAHSNTTHVLTKLPGDICRGIFWFYFHVGCIGHYCQGERMGDWAAASVRVSHPRRSWVTWNGHADGACRAVPWEVVQGVQPLRSSGNLKAVRVTQSLPIGLALLQTNGNMDAGHQLVPANHPLGSAWDVGGWELSILGKGMKTEDNLWKTACGSIPDANIHNCLNSGRCVLTCVFRSINWHDFSY